jgi:Family of unknown function (DUF6370)
MFIFFYHYLYGAIAKNHFMKSFFAVLLLSFLASTGSAQVTASKTSLPDPTKKVQVAEVSCGKCKLGLPGKTCDLAIRINDKAYYVDGADIDNFGDAHARDGMCNAVRKAEVQGELVDNRFKISYIKLLPEAKKQN